MSCAFEIFLENFPALPNLKPRLSKGECGVHKLGVTQVLTARSVNCGDGPNPTL